jgi:hypothetical protein
MPGINFDVQQVLGSAAPSDEGALNALEQALLAGDVSPQTHEAIRKRLSDGQTGVDGAQPPAVATLIAGLLLGSPEFQRR